MMKHDIACNFNVSIELVNSLENPVFSRVCKTLSHDTLINLVSCKRALLLNIVNARIATHLNAWWAMSHLVKYFATKNMHL